MSGENNAPEGGAQQTGEGAKTGDDGKEFQPVTYKTQEELDAAFSERATRAANSARAEALKFLPEGVKPEDLVNGYQEWRKAEDAKKDPAVLEREKHAETQRQLQAYREKEAREALSKEVAKELKIGDTPIPAELLAGTTKEAMQAHGAALISFIEQLAGKPGPRPPAHNPNQGYNHQDTVAAGDPIRNFFTTGSFQ